MASQFLGKDQPVDMSDLISFSMGFSKLGLVLGDVVSRLGDLEKKVNDPQAGGAAPAPATGEDSRPDRVNRTGAANSNTARPEAGAAQPTTHSPKAVSDAADPAGATGGAPATVAPGTASNAMVAVPAGDLAALADRVKALEDEIDSLRNAAGKKSPVNTTADSSPRDAGKTPADAAKNAEARAKAAERAAQEAMELAKTAADKADAVSDRLSKQLRQAAAPVDGAATADPSAAQRTAPSASAAAVDDLADQLAQLSKAVDKVAKQQRDAAGDVAALNDALRNAPQHTAGSAAVGAPADVIARIAALEAAAKKPAGTSVSDPAASTGGDKSSTNGEHQGSPKGVAPSDSGLRDAIRAVEDRVAKLESAPLSHGAGGSVSGPGSVGAGAGAGSAGDKPGTADKSGAAGKSSIGDQNVKDLAAKVAELQKRLDARDLPAQADAANVRGADPVDKTFATPSAGVELERLQSQLKQLAGDVDVLKQRAPAAGADASLATGAAPAPAHDYGDLPTRVDALQRALDDVNARVAGLNGPASAAHDGHAGEPSTEVANEAARAAHDARAASEAADQALKRLGEMNDGQDALRKKIQQIEAALAALPTAGASDANGTRGAVSQLSVEDAVKKVLADRDQATLKAGLVPAVGATATPPDNAAGQNDVQQSLAHQVLDIRATVDHLIHGKADAAQVANKAERDYVEGALEKLMQEVERVINITNASLIDTLDKSLGLLRDMIDGKATKADLAKARLLGAQGGAGANGVDTQQVPDGLIGFKSYRCLGCNRTVEAMRVRPMGSSAQAFSAKLPPSATTRQPKPPALSASLPALTAPLPPIPPSSA